MSKRIISIILAALMIVSLCACSGGSSAPATSAAETTAAPEATDGPETEAPETDAPAEQPQQVGETIVIEYGDVDAINDLAKKAQNFDLEEGTVAKIDGIFSEGVLTPSIMEDDGNGSKFGLTLYIDGDAELPADGSDIEVTGTFVKGGFFMEFHVKPEDIVVK